MTNKPRASIILLDSRFQHTCYASAMTLFLAIVVMGSIPGARHNLGQYASGLVLHSVAYAILGALIFFGSRGSASRRAISAPSFQRSQRSGLTRRAGAASGRRKRRASLQSPARVTPTKRSCLSTPTGSRCARSTNSPNRVLASLAVKVCIRYSLKVNTA